VQPAEWNRNDGFSPSQLLVVQVPDIDLEQTGAPSIGDLTQSLAADSPIVVIRASTGEQHLLFVELDANTADPVEQTLLIRPMEQYERGERYIVALRNLKDASGATIPAPEVFAALRDDVTTDNEAIEARRPEMNALLDELSDAGINRDELYLAWDFSIASVENITERLLHIRDQAFADLGAEVPAYSIDTVTDFAPCGDDGCAEGEDEQISREITGTFQIPNFLNTDSGEPGSGFFYDTPNDGLPDRMGGNNEFGAYFVCRIPRSVADDFSLAPIAIARPSLHGHGLLGSANEIRGAGELLGDEQSGQIHSVGFSMYMDMLQRAVDALRRGDIPDVDAPLDQGTEVNLHTAALIPEDYLPDVNSRLILYKRIAAAESDTALRNLQVEMIDRFGLLPPQVHNLFQTSKLRLRAESLGIRTLEAGPEGGSIEFKETTSINPANLVALVQANPRTFKLTGANRLRFEQAMPDIDQREEYLEQLMEQLASEARSAANG